MWARKIVHICTYPYISTCESECERGGGGGGGFIFRNERQEKCTRRSISLCVYKESPGECVWVSGFLVGHVMAVHVVTHTRWLLFTWAIWLRPCVSPMRARELYNLVIVVLQLDAFCSLSLSGGTCTHSQIGLNGLLKLLARADLQLPSRTVYRRRSFLFFTLSIADCQLT